VRSIARLVIVPHRVIVRLRLRKGGIM